MGLARTVAPSFRNLADRFSRPLALFSSKSLRSSNIVSSETKVNLNLELGNFRILSQCCRTEGKPNLKEKGGKLASKFLVSRGGFKGSPGVWPPTPTPPSFLAITYFIFCNHFEELRTVLFEVELIINNAQLTDVQPNTIKTCLTPIHFLFGGQLLCFSNTKSNVVRRLTIPSSTTNKINRISNHCLDRWRHEFMRKKMNIRVK